jgi:hypothetical protein
MKKEGFLGMLTIHMHSFYAASSVVSEDSDFVR